VSVSTEPGELSDCQIHRLQSVTEGYPGLWGSARRSNAGRGSAPGGGASSSRLNSCGTQPPLEVIAPKLMFTVMSCPAGKFPPRSNALWSELSGETAIFRPTVTGSVKVMGWELLK
jgi:hypothetical protein